MRTRSSAKRTARRGPDDRSKGRDSARHRRDLIRRCGRASGARARSSRGRDLGRGSGVVHEPVEGPRAAGDVLDRPSSVAVGRPSSGTRSGREGGSPGASDARSEPLGLSTAAPVRRRAHAEIAGGRSSSIQRRRPRRVRAFARRDVAQRDADTARSRSSLRFWERSASAPARTNRRPGRSRSIPALPARRRTRASTASPGLGGLALGEAARSGEPDRSFRRGEGGVRGEDAGGRKARGVGRRGPWQAVLGRGVAPLGDDVGEQLGPAHGVHGHDDGVGDPPDPERRLDLAGLDADAARDLAVRRPRNSGPRQMPAHESPAVQSAPGSKGQGELLHVAQAARVTQGEPLPAAHRTRPATPSGPAQASGTGRGCPIGRPMGIERPSRSASRSRGRS